MNHPSANKPRSGALVFGLFLAGFVSILVVSCGDYPVASLVQGETSTSTTSTSTTSSATSTGTDTGTTTGSPSDASLPCGVLADAGHECVSAHSTIRVIVPDYTGPLYQVDTGAAKQDIGSKDGYADAAAQDAFCAADGCTISIIYDQSGQNNHLAPSPPGSNNPSPGAPVPAEKLPTQINGHSTYGILIRRGFGYRAACNDCVYPENFPQDHRVPVGDEPQTVYMVTSGKDTNNGCCFDYGNAEITSKNDGAGTMEAVYIGGGVVWGIGGGEGPWVMADMENGLFPGWDHVSGWNYTANTSVPFDFVTGIVVGDTADKNGGKGRFAVYAGDSSLSDIKEMYDGIRPEKQGYVPMIKQGSIILGIGGDASNLASGRFYEGALALGAATKETVNALQSAIAEAGYGK